MNTKKFIILLFFTSIISSCEDAIDITQPGTFEASNIYKSMQDLRDSSNYMYGFLDTTDEMKFNSVYTDEISIGSANGGQAVTEYSLILASNSVSPNSIWRGNYITIAHVNRLIEGAATFSPDSSDLTEYNNIVGQAYALRAYLHFVIQSYFTEDLTDDSKLGGIILDKVVGADVTLPRSDNGDVFNFINSDLDHAETLIAVDNGTKHFDLNAINALRARMAAYRGLYSIAEPIASSLLVAFPLADSADFPNIWNDTSDEEIIWKIERSNGDGYHTQGSSMAAGGTAGSMYNFTTGLPYLEMGRSLFNLYSQSDVRYQSYIDLANTTIDPNYLNSVNYIQTDVLAIGKYLATETVDLMSDLKVFRSSEMLFIVAEAKANSNDYNGVASLLKQLRDKRFNASTPLLILTSEQEAFAAILEERRLELAFEGHRWLDLKRLGVIANIEIDRDSRDCQDSGICTLDKNSFKFTLPIPLTEMDVNSELIQNNNY